MTEYKQLGKYKILNELGEGGFGIVYHAYDTILQRDVALKVLRTRSLSSPQDVKRFTTEAQSAARLDHPNLVKIYDYGEWERRYYLVMQYLPQGTLAQYIQKKGALALSEALPIIKQIASGLEYAHSQNIVHRDVKPSNILFDPHGNAVLTDFGLVKELQSSRDDSTTKTVGTLAYIAPEIWDRKPVTPATDVYALACIVFEMLTGEILFKGDSEAEIMRRHFAERDETHPLRWSPHIPQSIMSVLFKALDIKPEERYSTVSQFWAALSDAAEYAYPKSQSEQYAPSYPETNEVPRVFWRSRKFQIAAIGIFLAVIFLLIKFSDSPGTPTTPSVDTTTVMTPSSVFTEVPLLQATSAPQILPTVVRTTPPMNLPTVSTIETTPTTIIHSPGVTKTITVRAGQGIYSVCQEHCPDLGTWLDLYAQEVVELNSLESITTALHVDQSLIMPACPILFMVDYGDTIYEVSRRYCRSQGVDIEPLIYEYAQNVAKVNRLEWSDDHVDLSADQLIKMLPCEP